MVIPSFSSTYLSLFWGFLTFWSCWYRLVPRSKCLLLFLTLSSSLALALYFKFRALFCCCFFPPFDSFFNSNPSLSPFFDCVNGYASGRKKGKKKKKRKPNKILWRFNIVTAWPNENWREMNNTTFKQPHCQMKWIGIEWKMTFAL